MKNWDEIRFFLATTRYGSARAAAEALHVNHATVLRRIALLEEKLGTQLFDKLPGGYRLTASGSEVVELAEQMEHASNQLEARIFGQDQNVIGKLRVALAPNLAANLLMPDIADFCALYPGIALELLTSYETVNLSRRQADVALRLVYEGSAPPDYLFGVKLHEIHTGIYMSPTLLAQAAPTGSPLRWLLKSEDGAVPGWAKSVAANMSDVPIAFGDMQSLLVAARASMGVAVLPCFVGDSDPELVRMPGSATHKYGMLWLLTHGETRKTKRIRLFSEFIRNRLSAHAALLDGSTLSVDR
ncbi:LysR family transcriptional regulator [Pseudomonas gingeri]|nr:LysR family transcriptional regulator [Pseudomonas gingeri]